MEQSAIAILGTVDFLPHGVENCIVLSFPITWLHSRDLLLHPSRFLGLALRFSRSCLPMPPGSLRHAGGWHLRSKPCAVHSLFLLHSPWHPHITAIFLRCVVTALLWVCFLHINILRRPTRNFSSSDIFCEVSWQRRKFSLVSIAPFRRFPVPLLLHFAPCVSYHR